ncbi:MAG: glycosyltransferase family 2 protein [Patescibacteria group bacterium]|mgnify:CR=1 FL=1
MEPLVSIILPIRNAEKFLLDCIKSLITQTYKNIEIIIVNDSSTDNSRSILRKFRKRDKRIRIIQNKKQYGVTVCLNRGVKKARGEFIAFMDARDVCHRKRLQKQVAYLLANSKTVVVGTFGVIIDKKSKKCGKIFFPKDNGSIYQTLMAGLSMQFETAMINTTLLPKDIIRFQKNTYPLFFSEMFVRLLPYGLFANLDKPLYYKRQSKTRRWQKIKQYPSLLKLFLKSKTFYNYHPSFWSIFLPLKTLIRH